MSGSAPDNPGNLGSELVDLGTKMSSNTHLVGKEQDWVSAPPPKCGGVFWKVLHSVGEWEAYDLAFDRLRSKSLQGQLLTAVSMMIIFVYTTSVSSLDLDSFESFLVGFGFCALCAVLIIPFTIWNSPSQPAIGLFAGACVTMILLTGFLETPVENPDNGNVERAKKFHMGVSNNVLFILITITMCASALHSVTVAGFERFAGEQSHIEKKQIKTVKHVKDLLRPTPKESEGSEGSEVQAERSDAQLPEDDQPNKPVSTLAKLKQLASDAGHLFAEAKFEAPALMDWAAGLTFVALLYCFITRVVEGDTVSDSYSDDFVEATETLEGVTEYLSSMEDVLENLQTTWETMSTFFENLNATQMDQFNAMLASQGFNTSVAGIEATLATAESSTAASLNQTEALLAEVDDVSDTVTAFGSEIDDMIDAINKSSYWGQLCGFTISLLCLLKPVMTFHRKMPDLRQGKERNEMGKWPLMSKLKMRLVPKFVGAQLSCILTQFYIVAILFSLIVFACSYEPVWDWWTHLLFVQYRNPLIVYCVSYIFQNYFLYPRVYEHYFSDHGRIAQPKHWTVMTLAMALYGLVTGAATGFMIVCYYFCWGLCVVGLADETILPASLVTLDTPFAGFYALQKLKHNHQNPVVVEATNRFSELGNQDKEPQPIEKVRARTRWQLIYTLTRNPKLVVERLDARAKLVERHEAEAKHEEAARLKKAKFQAELAHAKAALANLPGQALSAIQHAGHRHSEHDPGSEDQA